MKEALAESGDFKIGGRIINPLITKLPVVCA